MNITEIKNASRNDLIEYLERYGLTVYPDESMKTLRSEAMGLYWTQQDNEGFSYETVQGAY